MTEKTDLSLLELMSVSPADSLDQFTGQSESYGPIGVYGGHLVGQALAAGLATVDEPKLAHSLHCYFLRPGDPEVPIHYSVTRLREGRGSDVRAISGVQHGRQMFLMTASFKLTESGDEHQQSMPVVDDPETLLAGLDEGSQFKPPPTAKGRAQMVLASEGFMTPEFRPGRDPFLRVWMRCAEDTPDMTERDRQVMLAYLSDGTLMFNSVIPHGLPFRSHLLTSIDHAVWFHRPCDVNDWMLFDQHSSGATDGRGMNHGTVFDRDGRLIMTLAQESMLRKIPDRA